MAAVLFATSFSEKAWVGTVQRVPLRDTAGQVGAHALKVTDAVHLGCGCYRLYADRPGPRPGETGNTGISLDVQFLVPGLGGCGLHADEREAHS